MPVLGWETGKWIQSSGNAITDTSFSGCFVEPNYRKVVGFGLLLPMYYGQEFALHHRIAERLDARFYFAHPYAAWERATNENTNGLIRQYFTKDRDFTAISENETNLVMNRLNNRPRKGLGFKTPNQVFFGEESTVALTT